MTSNPSPHLAAGLLIESGCHCLFKKPLFPYLGKGKTLPKLASQASCKRKGF